MKADPEITQPAASRVVDLVGPRTGLLPIVPIGMGTSRAESLPSYFIRLAAYNGSTPSRMIFGPETRILGKTRPAIFELRTTSATLWNRGVVMTAPKGREIVKALCILTGREDLVRLHCGEWVEGFALRGLMRPYQCWCYQCLRNDAIPFMRMSWNFSQVSVCTAHKIRLTTECLNCRKRVRCIDPQGHFLRCHACGFNNLSAAPICPEAATAQEMFAAKSIGYLIAHASGGGHALSLESILDAIRVIATAHGFGASSAQARLFCLNSRGVSDGRELSLAKLLRVCAVKRISIFQLERSVSIPRYKLIIAVDHCRESRVRRRRSVDERKDIASRFGLLVRREPPPSNRELSAELGCDSSFLRLVAPSDYAYLLTARAEFMRMRTQKKIEIFKEAVRQLLAADLKRDLVRGRELILGCLPHSSLTRRPEIADFLQSQINNARAILGARGQRELPLFEDSMANGSNG